MTTLEKSYCVPRTDEEWAAIDALNPRIEMRIKGKFVFTLKENGKRRLWVGRRAKGNAKEIPVTHFLDLLHDRICAWRLEEVGFMSHGTEPFTYHTLEVRHTFKFGVGVDGVWLNGSHLAAVTTFTDLLILIRMLTPTTEKP